METKNKGITLIALIITIIVLLILAGVTIATLTGNHGILTQVDNAKVSTIESKVNEEIDLAVQSANLKIRIKKATDNSWNAVTEGILPTTAIAKTATSNITNEGENGAVLVTLLADLQKEGYYVEVTAVEGEGTGATRQITITYEGEDYQKAKKDGNAKITKTLDVSQNKIVYAACSHRWEDGEIIEATCTTAGSKKQTCTKCGETKTVTIEAGHTWNAGVETTAATCTEAGVKTYTCTVTGCDGTKTEEIPAGHNFVDGTCTECGVVLVGVKSINIENMTLDGASLITATLTNDKIATSADVTWCSDNSDVATVRANGIVKCGTKTGTAQITCTASDGTKKTCNVTNTASKIVYTNNGTANSTITGATTGFSYKQPIIPVGYSAIDTIDAKWTKTGAQTDYNKGLVIMDAKGNQYVWVPVYNNVNGETVDYAKWCTTFLSHSSCSDDTLSDGTTIASVDKTTDYGGFWIGRYEAGLDVDLGSNYQLTTSRNVTGEPIIVEGAIPWNYINYTNSRANAESLVNNTYIRSGLVNGTQWDTALKWIKSNTSLNVGDTGESTAWGNYDNTSLTLDRYKQISTNYGASWSSEEETTNGSTQMLRTGASTTTKSLNISDLAGNMWEWSNEICSSNRVNRGGSCDEKSVSSQRIRASSRIYNNAGNYGPFFRF